MLSFLGYICFLKNKLSLRAAFLPGLVSCSIIVLLYVSALLGILLNLSYAIFAGGLICLVMMIVKGIKDRFAGLRNLLRSLRLAHVFVLIFFAGYVIALWNARHFHNDNFSHWGLIVKDMLINNALPDASSVNITFTSYPPASALFMYYFCRIAGQSEGFMMIGQCMLELALLCSLFALNKKKSLFIDFITALSSCFIFLSINYHDVLFVDRLMPITALSALAVFIYYREQVSKAALLCLPNLIVLLLVKNNAVIFFIFNFFIMLYIVINNKPSKKELLIFISGIATAVLFMVSWNVHRSIVFDKSGFHDFSLEYFSSVFSRKDINITFRILKALGKKLLLSYPFYISIAGAIASALFFKTAFGLSVRKVLKLLLFLFALQAIYLLGLFSAYLFSMGTESALNVVSFKRYYASILIYYFGIVLLIYLSYANKHNPTELKCNFLAAHNGLGFKLLLCVIFIAMGAACSRTFVAKPFKLSAFEGSEAQMVAGMIDYRDGNYSYSNESIAIYTAGNSKPWRSANMLRYYIMPHRSALYRSVYFKTHSFDDFISEIKRYDRLIVVYEDDYVHALLKSYIGERESYAGAYYVSELFEN